MNTLYILTGTLFSTEAEQLLLQAGIPFEMVDVEKVGLLDNLNSSPLFINELPTLDMPERRLEGIQSIRTFVAYS